MIDLNDVYMTFFLPTKEAGRIPLGSEVRIVLDAAPQYVIPAKVTFVADVAQFTPKTVETASEREKLTFRLKAHIPRGAAAEICQGCQDRAARRGLCAVGPAGPVAGQPEGEAAGPMSEPQDQTTRTAMGAGGAQPAPVVRLSDVTLHYGKTLALNGINLDVPAGKMVGLIGPDGVGKSSTFALIAGAHVIQSGRVEVLGGDMADRAASSRGLPPHCLYAPGAGQEPLSHPVGVREFRFFCPPVRL